MKLIVNLKFLVIPSFKNISSIGLKNRQGRVIKIINY